MRSTSGTDILTLIKTLSKYGVKKYKDDKVEVEFFDNVPRGTLTPEKISDKIDEKPSSIPPLAQAHAEVDEQRKVADQLRRKEQVMSELLLTDPLKYEEMLEAGELTRAESLEMNGDGDEDAEETHA